MSTGKDLVRVRGKFPSDLVGWVVNPESELTEELEQTIDHLLSDRRKRVQLFLTALVRRHVERIIFLMGKFPQIEEELFTDRRLKTMKNGDLIRLLSVVGTQVEDASDFLQRFVSADDLRTEPLPSRRPGAPAEADAEEVADPTEDEKEALKVLPAESRKRVMRIFRKLLTTVEIVEQEIVEDTVEKSEAGQ